MSASSQDITFQATGFTTVGVVKKGLEYNITPGFDPTLTATLAGLNYGPPKAPPPPWTAGQQYAAYLPCELPDFGTLMPTQPNTAYPIGCISVLSLWDRSPNAVQTGGQYVFTVQIYPQIQAYVNVIGVAGGSVLELGFGLYSLPENPYSYTYITAPPDFDGEWSIGLYTPLSQTVMWLSLEYMTPKDYGGGLLQSRVAFTLEGALSNQTGPSGRDHGSGDIRGGRAYLHPKSSPHRVRAFEPA